MRFASFRIDGQRCYGVVSDRGIQPVSDQFISKYPDLKSAIAAEVLEDAATTAGSARQWAHDAVEFEPVIPNPGRILCVGVNYMTHIREMGREPPDKPVLFVRFPDSVVGHRQSLVKPSASGKYDYEGELAVIMGRPGRHISRGEAMHHVAGFACFNDGTVRDFQRHTSQFTPGKNFFHSGAFGPWMVSADEIPDPATLRLETRINGEIVQQGHVGDLRFDIPVLIEYCSIFCRLEPGDVIVTGTMGGVGAARTPPKWLQSGDCVEVEISGIGVLENRVIAE